MNKKPTITPQDAEKYLNLFEYLIKNEFEKNLKASQLKYKHHAAMPEDIQRRAMVVQDLYSTLDCFGKIEHENRMLRREISRFVEAIRATVTVNKDGVDEIPKRLFEEQATEFNVSFLQMITRYEKINSAYFTKKEDVKAAH